jgi:hypothetical protein
MQNEKEIEFNHLYRRDFISLLKKNKNKKKDFNLNSIEASWLPISNACFEHLSPGFIRNLLSIYLPNIFFGIFKKRVINKIEFTKPDIIHLNSVVLLPLVKFIKQSSLLKNCKIILHVRELVDLKNIRFFKEYIDCISSFVCIDYAVASRIMNAGLEINQKRISIQQNPFATGTMLNEDIKHWFKSDKIKFSIAGVIGKDKGVDFVCESFIDAKLDNAELLVIGKINNYAATIQKKYSNNTITWTGEIDSLSTSGAFSKINCLIRGEKQFCTGRTVYESLFSGGLVLLPGSEDDAKNDEFLGEFINQVFFYNPRDVVSFNNSINKIYSLITNNTFNSQIRTKSNYAMYAQFFKKKYSELVLA